MRVKCVRGPVFVDGAMMFSGQVKEVPHEDEARRLVAEHPHSLAFVVSEEAMAVIAAAAATLAPSTADGKGPWIDAQDKDQEPPAPKRRGRR